MMLETEASLLTSKCVACPPGTFNDVPNEALECEPCPDGDATCGEPSEPSTSGSAWIAPPAGLIGAIGGVISALLAFGVSI